MTISNEIPGTEVPNGCPATTEWLRIMFGTTGMKRDFPQTSKDVACLCNAYDSLRAERDTYKEALDRAEDVIVCSGVRSTRSSVSQQVLSAAVKRYDVARAALSAHQEGGNTDG